MKYLPLLTVGPLALLLLLIGLPAARAQAPDWHQPAVISPVVTTGIAHVRATATDAAGNVYVAGYFAGTAAFGNVSLSSIGGSNDAFVAKWSPVTGNFIWVRPMGGPGNDGAAALVVQAGDVYLAGNFTGATVSFGNLILTNAGVGLSDLFVAKLTDTGATTSFTWAQRGGGTSSDVATALAVTGSNVYVTGGMSGTATFGSTTLSSTGSSNMFVAKLTDAGLSSSFAWALNSVNAAYSQASALAVSGPNVYVSGNFSFSSTFGSLTLTSAGFDDLFVVKVTDAGASGSFTWAQSAGGADDEYASALAVSGANVYVAGSLKSSSASFGSTRIGTASPGDYAVFVAKLTDAGTASSFVWAQSAGAPGDDAATALAVEGARVYVAGSFSLTATFGNTTLYAAGARDVFVARLTDAGSSAGFVWAQQAGGLLNDQATSLAVQGANVYVGGGAAPPASFGAYTLTGLQNVNTGFLASLTDNTATAATGPAATTPGFYPNPAHTAVQVPGTTGATLVLLDHLGQTVRQGPGPTLSVRDVAPGLYVLRVATPGQPVRTGKLVVE